MRHLAPAPLGAVASLSARTAVRGAKVFRAGAKARGAPLVLRRSPSTVAAANVVPSEVLGNAVPLNNDAAHVTCGASPRPAFGGLLQGSWAGPWPAGSRATPRTPTGCAPTHAPGAGPLACCSPHGQARCADTSLDMCSRPTSNSPRRPQGGPSAGGAGAPPGGGPGGAEHPDGGHQGGLAAVCALPPVEGMRTSRLLTSLRGHPAPRARLSCPSHCLLL